MNILCLEKYGVSEMETREMKEANGGFLGAILAGIAGYVIGRLIWKHNYE